MAVDKYYEYDDAMTTRKIELFYRRAGTTFYKSWDLTDWDGIDYPYIGYSVYASALP